MGYHNQIEIKRSKILRVDHIFINSFTKKYIQINILKVYQGLGKFIGKGLPTIKILPLFF